MQSKQKQNVSLKQERIVVGNAIFDQKANKIMMCQWFLKDNNWEISFGHYYCDNWKHLFKHMIESKVEILRISWSQPRLQYILKEISHINFPNLKQLILYKHNIRNVQVLGQMNLQNLLHLSLKKNQIFNIKGIKKLKIKLCSLDLAQNPIRDLRSLTKLNRKTIFDLFLQQNTDEYEYDQWIDQAISQDLSILTKLKCQSILKLRTNKDFRIGQTKLNEMLLKRHTRMVNKEG